MQADRATPEGCEALARSVDELGRPLEAIALNAGVGTGGELAGETNLDGEINIVELNCVGTVRVAKWAARKMAAQGRGRMLVTASVAGIMPTPLEAVYGASKASRCRACSRASCPRGSRRACTRDVRARLGEELAAVAQMPLRMTTGAASELA